MYVIQLNQNLFLVLKEIRFTMNINLDSVHKLVTVQLWEEKSLKEFQDVMGQEYLFKMQDHICQLLKKDLLWKLMMDVMLHLKDKKMYFSLLVFPILNLLVNHLVIMTAILLDLEDIVQKMITHVNPLNLIKLSVEYQLY